VDYRRIEQANEHGRLAKQLCIGVLRHCN